MRLEFLGPDVEIKSTRALLTATPDQAFMVIALEHDLETLENYLAAETYVEAPEKYKGQNRPWMVLTLEARIESLKC